MTEAKVLQSEQKSKTDLPTARLEAAILETMFSDKIEKPILKQIQRRSQSYERLMNRDVTDLSDQEAKKLLNRAHYINEELKDLEGALFHCQHLELVYLDIINATVEYYERKIKDPQGEVVQAIWPIICELVRLDDQEARIEVVRRWREDWFGEVLFIIENFPS